MYSAGSTLAVGLSEKRKRRCEEKIEKINNVLRNIYSPLNGNRLLFKASIEGMDIHYAYSNTVFGIASVVYYIFNP